MTYIDKYGRYHDKPCINGQPKSNNGWIYTAYANKLGLPLDKDQLWDCKHACQVWSSDPVFMYHTRSPGKELPPMSRDEILGMAALRLITPNLANAKNWNFSPRPIPKFNPIKLAAQLWQLRPSIVYTRVGIVPILEFKHRNYFWENNLDQLYRFAFSVPLVDRAFILECWGETNSLRYYLYKAIAKLDSMSSSESGIRWLKYGKSLEAMQKEFPEDHPFRLTN